MLSHSEQFLIIFEILNSYNMKKLTTETVFPLIILTLSIISLFNMLSGVEIPRLLFSLLGIISAVLYFIKIRAFRYLMYIWILGQVVVIERETLDAAGMWVSNPLWDVTQTFNLNFGFFMKFAQSKVGINLNLLALFFFGLLKVLSVSSLIGTKFLFKKFGPNNKLGNIFPLSGTAIKRVIVSGKKDYLLIQLDFPFVFNEKEISYVLIKDKQAGLIQPGAKGQLVYFKLVKDINDVQEGDNDGKKFPFIDWAYCE
jgi:hypothetical protein